MSAANVTRKAKLLRHNQKKQLVHSVEENIQVQKAQDEHQRWVTEISKSSM